MMRGNFHNRNQNFHGGGGRGRGGRGGKHNNNHAPLNTLPGDAFFRPVMLSNPWQELEERMGLPVAFEAVRGNPKGQMFVPLQVEQPAAPVVQFPAPVSLDAVLQKLVAGFGFEEQDFSGFPTVEEKLDFCVEKAVAMYKQK